MASNLNDIPQVGIEAASLEESHPGTKTVPGCSSDSGGSKLTPAKQKTTTTWAAQLVVKCSNVTGQIKENKEESSPFAAKSQKTKRSPGAKVQEDFYTPPKDPPASTSRPPSSSPEETVEGKRKRKEGNETEEEVKVIKGDLGNLETLLCDAAKAIERLGLLVRENANTKTEIKKMAYEMQSYAKMMKDERLKSFVTGLAEAKIEQVRKETGYKTPKVDQAPNQLFPQEGKAPTPGEVARRLQVENVANKDQLCSKCQGSLRPTWVPQRPQLHLL